MAITARLVGKLGGADVEAIPVSMSSEREIKEFVLHRVEVPNGERRLIVVEGVFTQISTNESNYPFLVVGDQKSRTGHLNLPTPSAWGWGGILSQTGNVSIETTASNSLHNVSFSGTLYVVPLD